MTILEKLNLTEKTRAAMLASPEARLRQKMTDAIDNQIAAARARNIPVVIFSLQAINGGSGESGQAGSRSGKWAMSADEIRRYGMEFLSRPEAAGLYAWEFDPDEVLAGDCASNDYWMDRCGVGSGRADAWRDLRRLADSMRATTLLRN